ncbi:hypothetical protein JW887_00205 [Candidatus Dojkabacteria bacterium]|nr:hypothetical protein [Candidatus Dojkabacteria bacterium]
MKHKKELNNNEENFQKIFTICLFALFGVILFVRTILITNHSDFLNTYKYFTNDSYMWIANGIYYFRDKAIAYPNLGLSLVIKILWNIKAISILPYIYSSMLFLIIFFVNRSIYILNKKKNAFFVSTVVTIAMMINYDLLDFSKYILADIFAHAFIAISTYFAIKKKLNLTFLFLGISALFQNYAYFIATIWIFLSFWEFFKEKKLDFKSSIKKTFLLGFVFIIPNLPVLLYKFIEFGNPLYTKVIQFQLLDFHTDSIFFYIVNLIDIYTFPVICLVLFMIAIHAFQGKFFKFKYLYSGLLWGLFFWIFCYDWNDKRFMLYILPFVYLIAGNAMSYIINLMEKLKDIRGAFLFFLISILFLHSFNNVSGFLTPNQVVLFPDLSVAFERHHNGSSGDNIDTSFEFQTCSYKSIVERTIIIDEFSNKDFYQGSKNVFYVYSEFIDDRYDYKNNSICILPEEDFDMYVFNSVLKIKTGKYLTDLELIENCK